MRKRNWHILSSSVFIMVLCIIVPIVLFMSIPVVAIAEMIDPEIYIKKNGYQSQRMGDDGKTPFYNFTERTTISRVTTLEKDIAALPKHEEVAKYCEFIRGGTKAELIQSTGKAIDVAVTNYGYKGATVACVLKYMYGNEVGTQLVYSKKAGNAMFMVFVTH